ncbi:zinc finger protein 891-like [Trichogramma pretiosum]|uniref:zinc finger protein 891-like n=1 Tax=Trichogramma pretiosum TaxID=7493 RepID=UPI0006C9A1E9|nr:zinc finger protein 891-like [Trichogramma pretiosum]
MLTRFQVKRMKPSDLFDCGVRVKEEPSDVPFRKNDYEVIDEKPDFKNVQLLSFPRENSSHTLRKYDLKHEDELGNEAKIVFESEDVKPNMAFLAVKKIDSNFKYHLQNVTHSDGYKTQNIVNEETVVEVKQEYVHKTAEQLNFNLDMHNGVIHSCDECKKLFRHKNSLRNHINEMHRAVTHTCNTCGKSFSTKSNLKNHVDSVHKGITHACDTCGKKYSTKWYLKVHMNSVHD